MNSIILNKAGGVENLQYIDTPIPAVKPDEVLIKTISVSINPVDFKARKNEGTLSWLFDAERPVTLGWDVSGVVEKVGENVTEFKEGDEVFGMVNFPGKGNAYAEYVAAPATHLSLKPSNISHQEAAAATLAMLTAWQVFKAKGLKKGDKVLVHGASGGVGHYATQIAKYLEAYVIGTSSSKNKEFVLNHGADQHIDYQAVPFESVVSDVDFVLDTLAGDIISRSIDVTKKGGVIVTIPSGSIPQDYLDKAAAKNINLSFILVQSSGSDMKEVAKLLNEGIVKSHVSETFKFNEMGGAHLQLETGRTVGKIVVNI